MPMGGLIVAREKGLGVVLIWESGGRGTLDKRGFRPPEALIHFF